MNDKWTPSLEHIYRKTRRAKLHLEALEQRVVEFVNARPYTITEHDDPQGQVHAFIIKPIGVPESIPLIAGDFVSCLRSSLDHLAWNLVHLDPATVPKNDKHARKIVFPICETAEAYASKLALFPPAMAPVFDSLQPKDRANAYLTHHLWRLDKLWNIDKHRTIPMNGGYIRVSTRDRTKAVIDRFENGVVVCVPSLSRVQIRPVYPRPIIEQEIVLGEHMGGFMVGTSQLRTMYDFVTQNVIPKFAGFFPKSD
jgi:hypothetical protein